MSGTRVVPPLSVSEVAALAGVSRRFVHKAIGAGVLRAKRVGAHFRVPRSAALAFAVDCGGELEEPVTSAHNAPDAHSAHSGKLRLARG